MLSGDVRELPGVGPARARALGRLGIRTAHDLLYWFPREYEDRTRFASIGSAPADAAVCVLAAVAGVPRTVRVRKGLEITKVKVTDPSSCMTLTFFNQSYVKNALSPGAEYVFYGTVEGPPGRRSMTNPVFESASARRLAGRIIPIYPLTAGLSNPMLISLTERVTGQCAAEVPEVIPEAIRLRYHLAQTEFAYRNIHFPPSWEELDIARRRLIFEELFCLSAGLLMLRERRVSLSGFPVAAAPKGSLQRLFPFRLTAAQERVIEEAAADMAGSRPMNRLVQGDVGSGKTAVAAACVWLTAKAGYQSAMMAPTGLLARQHYNTLSKLLSPAGITVGLLTGSTPPARKRAVYADLAEGKIDLVVGTHALLSEGVAFSALGLVVTDEQHRFGVGQRAALSQKGEGGLAPHVLVMSATPIPRTLALIIYGDLDVSVLDELPPGRSPVKTYIIGQDKRERMYGFVRRLAREGRQTYIVCPAVEEGEASDGGQALKAAAEYAESLRKKVFPDLRVGLVHGRLKAREKEEVMHAFAAGETDVLVATTVIEVGVDVPNAALMVVENAERFGLSQLHQLRGRVGRGEHRSYCVLVTETRNADSLKRLHVLTATGDGFLISQEDLKLRGPGDFFGARQHGLPRLKIADLAGDMRVLRQAQDAARALLKRDPALTLPEHQPLLSRLRRMFEENPGIFN